MHRVWIHALWADGIEVASESTSFEMCPCSTDESSGQAWKFNRLHDVAVRACECALVRHFRACNRREREAPANEELAHICLR